METKNKIDIIIPTYNNPQQLKDTVMSMLRVKGFQSIRIIIVNNGDSSLDEFKGVNDVVVIKAPNNLGWTGGLKLGLEKSSSKYVVFANDDILIPLSSCRWLQMFRQSMDFYTDCAMIGPSSNCVMGKQNIFSFQDTVNLSSVPYLIGFCVMVRREALDSIGGIDTEFAHGDDIELGIRFRAEGHVLLYHPGVFVYHHGFQTGSKLYGDHTTPGGWNSPQMTEDTNTHIIKKHGFMKWWKTLVRWDGGGEAEWDGVDSEGNSIRPHVIGDVIEVGCGGTKTTEARVGHSNIGIDLVPSGEINPITGQKSVADFICDASSLDIFMDDSTDTIIARHILEHLIDPIEALKEWRRVARSRIILALPNEDVKQTIQLNEEHKHAYTPNSVRSLICTIDGLSIVEQLTEYSPDSFVTIIDINKSTEPEWDA